MRFVAISDTHGKHGLLPLAGGDVLIHAGDISMGGLRREITLFMEWFSKQPFETKILIAGNHDFFFENASKEDVEEIILNDIIYLNDSGTTINGIKIWGSPVSPWFNNWAFNRYRGPNIRKHWDLIPGGTNILITHGPVHGILDKLVEGPHVGCEDLLERVNAIEPMVHVCGHIHEAYGVVQKNKTKFINASVLNERYRLVNEPIVFEL